jgi:hypothetical protein
MDSSIARLYIRANGTWPAFARKPLPPPNSDTEVLRRIKFRGGLTPSRIDPALAIRWVTHYFPDRD